MVLDRRAAAERPPEYGTPAMAKPAIKKNSKGE